MGFLEFPNPVAWLEGAKTAGLERDEINALASVLYSAQITFLWRSGSSKWAQWVGEGQAMKDAATAIYLSLEQLQKKGFLTLTVPKDLLDADNRARFQTSYQTK